MKISLVILTLFLGSFVGLIGGADDEWDGEINTKALRQSEFDHPAAQWCVDLNIEGFNDFYLPSRRELALCYANVPDLFAKVWHWSSTQYSAYSAWGQSFDIGYQIVVIKNIRMNSKIKQGDLWN